MTPANGQIAPLQAAPTLPPRTRNATLAPAREAATLTAPYQPGDRSAWPGTYTRTDLGLDPAAAAQARRLTRDTLTRWHLSHLIGDAETIASEIVTNAIQHAVPPRGTLPAIIFAIHYRPGEIRIIVWDNGPGRPIRVDSGPDAENGRGLAIIDVLTSRNWGWWPTPRSGGKVIWAACAASAGQSQPKTNTELRAPIRERHAAVPCPDPEQQGRHPMDDYLRKRMLAVNVLLEIPEDIPDGLESELYCYRDTLQAEALSA